MALFLSGFVMKSRMKGDFHVRFCERFGGEIPPYLLAKFYIFIPVLCKRTYIFFPSLLVKIPVVNPCETNRGRGAVGWAAGREDQIFQYEAEGLARGRPVRCMG
jgi:hypothetical protein